MRKIITLAFVGMLALALASPVYAGRGHGGGGSHGGRGGGSHGSHGRFPSGGFHHGGHFHRGCCFGPAFVGGVFVGSALAYPYYSYPYYSSPYYDSSYSYPAYPDPVYQPQTQLSVAPSREVCYVGGCYRLQGDGVTVAYRWIWIPTVPNPPPPPPSGPPAGPPTSGMLAPSDSVPSRPPQQLYRWVDDQGVANWTNNGQAVPQRYRSQAQ